MSYYLDITHFVALIKTKQGNKTLRDLGEEIKISASTLSRILNHSFPDMTSFFLICDWLNLHPKVFIKNPKEDCEGMQFSLIEEIEFNLRMSSLDKDFTDGIIKVIRAYINNQSGEN